MHFKSQVVAEDSIHYGQRDIFFYDSRHPCAGGRRYAEEKTLTERA
jgi:hypothetical protein